MLMMLALVLLLTAVPAGAEQGFLLGATVPFNRVSGDLNDLNTGYGIGVYGGYGVNRYLSFVADAFRTKHALKSGDGSVYLKGITLDIKVNVPISGSRIEPYIRGGVGRYILDHTENPARGNGRQTGIGMDIVLIPELIFSLGLTSRRIDFDTVPGKKSSVSSFEYGVIYRFL